MAEMLDCPSCGGPFPEGRRCCPHCHCSYSARKKVTLAIAAAIGLGAAGCGDDTVGSGGAGGNGGAGGSGGSAGNGDTYLPWEGGPDYYHGFSHGPPSNPNRLATPHYTGGRQGRRRGWSHARQRS